MKELTEKQLEQIIDAFQSTTNTTEFKAVLKIKGLIKEELEVGKWYKYSDSEGFLFCITNVQNDGVEVYGFNSWGNWIDEGSYYSEYLIPATDKEVKDALIKEAKKRGFKEGVKFKSIVSGNIRKFTGFYFGSDEDECWLSNDTVGCIFKKGKWAEIIEEKKEIVVNGVTYIEK